MPTFTSFDGLKLAYDAEGDGPLLVLLHGIVVDSYINFMRPGLVGALASAGFRVVTLDQRGHGASEKPHDEARYADGAMVKDAKALLDHLAAGRCGFLGYSMGAMIGFELIPQEPRIAAAFFGGVGAHTLIRHTVDGGQRNIIADAMLAPDKRDVTDPIGRSFRDFADLVGTDKVAVAAASTALPRDIDPGRITVPSIVVCGDNDPLAGDPQAIADAIAGAEARVVGGTHLNVVNNHEFHAAAVGFFDAHREAIAAP